MCQVLFGPLVAQCRSAGEGLLHLGLQGRAAGLHLPPQMLQDFTKTGPGHNGQSNNQSEIENLKPLDFFSGM